MDWLLLVLGWYAERGACGMGAKIVYPPCQLKDAGDALSEQPQHQGHLLGLSWGCLLEGYLPTNRIQN